MFKKFPGNVQEDSGECYQRFWGMLSKILGNVQEDSGECSERFRRMFRKIPGNAFNFKLIKATFYLKKRNAKLISEAWSIFAISNETIERSNKMIWYFHFFWNSNWKEIARPLEKAKK